MGSEAGGERGAAAVEEQERAIPIVETEQKSTCIGEFGSKEGCPSTSLRTRAWQTSPSWRRLGVHAGRAGKGDGRAKRKTAAAVEMTLEKPFARVASCDLLSVFLFYLLLLLLQPPLCLSPLASDAETKRVRALFLSVRRRGGVRGVIERELRRFFPLFARALSLNLENKKTLNRSLKNKKKQELGIAAADLKRLKEGGINTIEALAHATKKELCLIKGISEAKVVKMQQEGERFF